MADGTLSRLDIRALAQCPTCGALPGLPCRYRGRGAAKAERLSRNHFERMQAAQAINNGGRSDVVLIEPDTGGADGE